MIVLIISEKKTKLIPVDKLVTVIQGKQDVCSNLELRRKGEEYYIVLLNVSIEFDWKFYNNDISQNSMRNKRITEKDSQTDVSFEYEESSMPAYRNGEFKVESVYSFWERKVYKVYGVNDGLNLLNFLENCLKDKMFTYYELLDKYNMC